MFSARIITNRESASVQSRERGYRSRVRIVSKIPGVISAKVAGSQLYTTSISKNKQGDYINDCSYPYGATCKHTIALTYIIEADGQLRSLLDMSEKPVVQEAEIVKKEKKRFN